MDNLTKEQRRRNMQNIRSADTKAELLIARQLRKKKIYFAKNVKSIFGRPDFVFRRKRIAVFVDSDFWHGHPGRCIMPKSNKTYWNQKIKRNKQRDREVNSRLKKEGWIIIRIWEHDLKFRFEKVFNKILNAVRLQKYYKNYKK